MKVYVFGNADTSFDNKAIEVAKTLESDIPDINLIFIKPNEDVPFIDEKRVVILDTVQGLEKVELITGADLDKISISPRGSVHDFDLAFQLKYLKKLGKIGEVFIVGIPQEGEIDYLRIKSVLKKLAASDPQIV